MNVDVYLIYGFLNAGKTSYINMVLSTPGMRGKRIAVLQCEEGETELTAPKACYVTMINRVNDITTNMLLEMQENVIEISDNDYHIFYMDISERPEKYRGKTIKMKCLARKYSQLGDNAFFAGRPVIVCCEQDIQFLGLICEACACLPRDEHWILLESTVDVKFHSAYMRV